MRTSLTHLVTENLVWEQNDIVLKLNNFLIMARLKQSQNIDSLIQNIDSVIESRCSLSDKDLLILSEALNLLKSLKKKKGKTNEQILQVVVEVVVLLSKFFIDSDEKPQ